MKKVLTYVMVLIGINTPYALYAQSGDTFKQWSEEIFSVIERDFRMPNSALYAENIGSSYAYNWPMGIQLEALIAAGKTAQAEALANEIHAHYWCFRNNRWGYDAAYNTCNSRFYDDNAWIAKALLELYKLNHNTVYLNRAKEVLAFVMSGEFAASSDPMRTTGSIRWQENSTTDWCLCASAPAAVANLLVYQQTGEQQYLNNGLRIYNWAKTNRWGAGGGYRGYENAVLAQAAVLLYRATNDVVYYNDARHIGYKMETAYIDWASHTLYETGQWGGHDMTNAYVDLYELDKDINWLNIAAGYLSFLYANSKDAATGRYTEDWSDVNGAGTNALLHQAPVAAAYARMGTTPGGTPKHPEPVAIFRDCNFAGQGNHRWSTGLLIGQYTTQDLAFIGVPDNDISSVKVQPGYKVTLFENDNFTGASVVKTADESCLVADSWNDRASSIIVEAVAPGAVVYKDCNFTGRPIHLPAGDYDMFALNARGVSNDDISSLKIAAGYEVQVFQNYNFTGTSAVIGSEDACLVDNGLNDWISSIRIRAKSSFSTTLQAESFSTMSGIATETTTDAGAGQNVGWIETGDWLSYTNITVPSTGSYLMEYRVASPNTGGRLSLDLNAGAIQLGTVDIPNTGGWQNWQTASHTVSLTAGTYNLGIYATTGGWNINWIRISRSQAARSSQEGSEPETSVEVYPNPVHSRLFLNTTSLTGAQIRIINTLGVIVAEQKTHQEGIDVSHLPTGVYTIAFTKDGKQVVKRFVKH